MIELGPEGGEGGGHLVAEGTPDDLRRNPRSLTGRFLAGDIPPPAEETRETGAGRSDP